MPSAHFLSQSLCCHTGCVILDIRITMPRLWRTGIWSTHRKRRPNIWTAVCSWYRSFPGCSAAGCWWSIGNTSGSDPTGNTTNERQEASLRTAVTQDRGTHLAVAVGFGADRQAAELHAVLIAGRDLQALQLLEGMPCYFIRSQKFTLLCQSIQRVPEPHVKELPTHLILQQPPIQHGHHESSHNQWQT